MTFYSKKTSFIHVSIPCFPCSTPAEATTTGAARCPPAPKPCGPAAPAGTAWVAASPAPPRPSRPAPSSRPPQPGPSTAMAWPAWVAWWEVACGSEGPAPPPPPAATTTSTFTTTTTTATRMRRSRCSNLPSRRCQATLSLGGTVGPCHWSCPTCCRCPVGAGAVPLTLRPSHLATCCTP